MSITSDRPADDLPVIQQVHKSKEWVSSLIEETIEPELPIIDAHHHFSDHWGGYLGEDLLGDMRTGHRVQATVYIQCGYGYRNIGPDAFKPVGEVETVVAITQSLLAQHKQDAGIAAGIVGYADLALGDRVSAVLAEMVQAGQGRLRGIRYSAARHPDFRHGVLSRALPDILLDTQFRLGFACLERHGLSFDSWTYHQQLDQVVDLARAFPGTQIIVNHIGGLLGVGPYKDKPSLARQEWLKSIRLLAGCENVVMKLGGLGTAVFGYDFSGRTTPPSSRELADVWAPDFTTCIDLFGADRCMFESNFPVDRSVGSYHVLWNAFKRIAADASSDEKAALFHDTAERVYRLNPVSR